MMVNQALLSNLIQEYHGVQFIDKDFVQFIAEADTMGVSLL
jgi:hypothetical protein